MIEPVFKLDSGEHWRPQPVETVETLSTIGDKPTKLDALPPAGGRMNFPSTMTDATDTPVVGYHRSLQEEGLWWHQFWLWYLYNPWEIAGVGKHEGDWEFVQLACLDEAGDRPVLITASQHHSGGKREFWNCEREGGRPVIYVAKGSHANYLSAGYRDGDFADGSGKVLDDIEWRAFGAWATWPGQWGNSTGEGKSPDSPGSQTERWQRPQQFHARAR